ADRRCRTGSRRRARGSAVVDGRYFRACGRASAAGPHRTDPHVWRLCAATDGAFRRGQGHGARRIAEEVNPFNTVHACTLLWRRPTMCRAMAATAARAAAPPQQTLLRETVGSIAVLRLIRPAARTSLSAAMMAELPAALNDIRDDKSVRGVVIAANGPAFSAGH